MEKCQIKDLFHFLGKKWSFQLIHALSEKSMSYNEILNCFSKQINPTLLSKRLKEMVVLKIIKRKKIYKHVLYTMTDRGKELVGCVHKIKDWAKNCNYQIPDCCKDGDCICTPRDLISQI